MLSNGSVARLSALLVVNLVSAALADEEFMLQEPVSDQRVFQVDVRLSVAGQLETALGEGKAQALDLSVKARHAYRERRLSGTGRGAAALRTLRHYDRSTSDIRVAEQPTSSRLRDGRRRIIAQGRRQGVEFHSPAGKLTRTELDLLEMPGDSLAFLGLLPLEPVAVGEEWEPESWAAQMLTGTEAALESKLTCRLASVMENLARVEFSGSIEGATAGAKTEIQFSGDYLYDLNGQFIRKAKLIQDEKRSVGTVSPGMKVEAKVVLERGPAGDPRPLTDATAESIPLEPEPSLMLLVLPTPWGIRLEHGRNWHLFQQAGDSAVLRLMEDGSLIAQCNIRRIAPASPGKHTPETEFQTDIRKTLGDRLTEITMAEQLQVDDGRFLYRVTAAGKASGVDTRWIYYLCAAPSGRQTSFVFAVESDLLERLGNRDLAIVKSIEFLPHDAEPARAADSR